MDGDEDLVAFTVDADRVVVVFVALVTGWRELHVDVFGDSRWYHTLLVVPNFEIGSLWRQYMEPLGCWRVVDQSHFQSVCLACLEARKLNHGGARLEYLI